MKVSYSKGLAIHTGPESCGYVSNDISEALTGESAGWPLSSERGVKVPGADTVLQVECDTATNVIASLLWPGGVQDPMHARKLSVRNTGDPVVGLTASRGPSGEPLGGTSRMNDNRKSDRLVVPKKQTNEESND